VVSRVVEHGSRIRPDALRLDVFEAWVRLEGLDVARRLPFRHGEVVQDVVPAVDGCRARDLAFVVAHVFEGAKDQRVDSLGGRASLYDEVVAGEAAHGPPVNDAVLPLRVAAKVGRHDVLDRVERVGVDGGFGVRVLHAHVERRDEVSTDFVDA